MALLFMDGFDAGDVTLKWVFNTGNGLAASTDTRFSSGRSVNCQGSWSNIYKNIPATNPLYVGFALKLSSNQFNNFVYFGGDTGTTTHLALRYSSSGVLTLSRGGTDIASAAAPTSQTWRYFEVSTNIHSSTGQCIVRIDGTQVINFSGNTKNGGTASSIDRITFGHLYATNELTYVDDLYMCDSTGSAPYNTFLNDVRVHTIVPNGAGSSTQMTASSGANYTTVDELPYSATDYVYGTAGQTDLYATSDLPAGAGVIYGVQTNAIVKKTDAGTISGRTALKSGASTYYSTSTSVGTTDQVVSRVDQTNPATSATWTSSEVNGIEIGVGAA